jgi:hypothetical protein
MVWVNDMAYLNQECSDIGQDEDLCDTFRFDIDVFLKLPFPCNVT